MLYNKRKTKEVRFQQVAADDQYDLVVLIRVNTAIYINYAYVQLYANIL